MSERSVETDTSRGKTARTAGTGRVREPGVPENNVRFVTAASLFDGHDASINIIRRLLQRSGAEVIHLGHNRSVHEIVNCAIEEDVQGIAVSSYQGGHMEYFTYMIDLLKKRGAPGIRVFGGGGGVIADHEISDLHEYGVTRIFSVDDGSEMGLQGMINYMIRECDFDPAEGTQIGFRGMETSDRGAVARAITTLENGHDELLRFSEGRLSAGDGKELIDLRRTKSGKMPLVGLTGTGGAGKSSLTDELVRRFLTEFETMRIGIISIDPSNVRRGGALLGDRIRMNSIDTDRVFMRSMATRSADSSVSDAVRGAVAVYQSAGFDLVIVETSGIGQSDTSIAGLVDIPIYVMTHEYGAATQLEKINMLELADFVVLNKFDKKESLDALRDIRKQVRRNRGAWHDKPESMPVYPTIASRFNDEGVNRLFKAVTDRINDLYGLQLRPRLFTNAEPAPDIQFRAIIPGKRQRYLSEIADAVRDYHAWAEEQASAASKLEQVEGTIRQLENTDADAGRELNQQLLDLKDHWSGRLDGISRNILDNWETLTEKYSRDVLAGKIRNRTTENRLYSTSLSGTRIPRVSLPKTTHRGERLRFALKENLPGYFPYTAGVYPFKREGEDPARMFAGEGTPERTNRRFHYVSEGLPAARLSTAFDSVTLYGEDPGHRPDIYGKIGNSGVSICTLDDMKKLYSGFELTAPSTSVSMTINGPASIILAMFMNTAVDQQVEKYLKENGRWEEAGRKIGSMFADRGLPVPEYSSDLPPAHDRFGLGLLGVPGDRLVNREIYEKIKSETLSMVRGTVQADILKEDQAQNTCIFSTEFALKMMGDIQVYFTRKNVRNYYSVSISGYHIAEAGANPVTQAAFTLANGFTYVEYYLSRGLDINDFAHNLSFFFSNGLDPEYAVIGRVARRIWAIALKNRYGANERSRKLKYHIQTSGRSLHAREIQFNDIRTTLQALLAIYDNCNSLHTNAYDEAITTPTEGSVRRALAIQMIINRELGTAKNENINQGSYFIEELTDLVEDAILKEFDRLTERGGVPGAMENMYQRGKIQDESLHYESMKHSGELPIIGVNTFLSEGRGEETGRKVELIRSDKREKEQQIRNLEEFHSRNRGDCGRALDELKAVARGNGNIFETLMETVKSASLGQISNALYDVGGQYRRNM